MERSVYTKVLQVWRGVYMARNMGIDIGVYIANIIGLNKKKSILEEKQAWIGGFKSQYESYEDRSAYSQF
jgi:hypothetical protein